MKKVLILVISLMMTVLFAACGNATEKNNSSGLSAEKVGLSSSAEKTDGAATAEKVAGKKILVAYFSRTGENYEVGNITKGNTHIVADMIAEATGADTFKIKTVKPYPTNYRECTEIAKRELADEARPELATKVENMQDYDVIFLGYPIWWGDMPMAVYTFIESYDFSGKTVIPFSTAAGSGLSGTDRNVAKACKGANVLEGLGIEGKMAQNEPDKVRPNVTEWLAKLGFAAKK
ncbi:hypothetical protein SPSIL_005740 [Sporomusa silvacetica DSM 10669]|uniref:Flavodoxin-like domain-containing protein n=1 Tax=Sporomusa silvacetica DSM 10669 TaxID=1123289 RepID=A0ABZ3IFM1_9FIRM|nr:flavodoxin [Sporomusa silvacetica]OZC17101.1 flavodoxin [Sporomusa silvacetica DSM 10669]